VGRAADARHSIERKVFSLFRQIIVIKNQCFAQKLIRYIFICPQSRFAARHKTDAGYAVVNTVVVSVMPFEFAQKFGIRHSGGHAFRLKSILRMRYLYRFSFFLLKILLNQLRETITTYNTKLVRLLNVLPLVRV
jgi:hypothetical protein